MAILIEIQLTISKRKCCINEGHCDTGAFEIPKVAITVVFLKKSISRIDTIAYFELFRPLTILLVEMEC